MEDTMCLYDIMFDAAHYTNCKKKTYAVVKPLFFDYVRRVEASNFKVWQHDMGVPLTRAQGNLFAIAEQLWYQTYGHKKIAVFKAAHNSDGSPILYSFAR